MYSRTQYNPVVGPQGQTLCVLWNDRGRAIEEWYFTTAEAIERRDLLLDAKCKEVRVLGLPTVIAGG